MALFKKKDEAQVQTSGPQAPKKRSKFKTGCLGIIVIFILLIAGMAMCGHDDSNNSNSSSSSQTTTSTSKSSSSSKSSSKESETPQWNKKEADATKNGNLKVAVQELKKQSDIQSIAEQADPETVLKRPWDYYGKVIAFTGKVSDITDNPPDSNESKAFGGSSYTIVLMMNGATVQGEMQGDSGSIKKGDTTTIYGYPVGTIQGKNRMGGSSQYILIVGK